MPVTTLKKSKFYGLQILRGISSLLVVLFHLTETIKGEGHGTFLNGIFKNSSSAVSIFFVLSGFIIYVSSKKLINSKSTGLFYAKRLIRIFPVYWFSISYVTLYLYFLKPSNLPDSFPEWIKTLILFPGHTMLNGVSWSLSYELFFYLLFGLLILNSKSKYFLFLLILLSLARCLSIIDIDFNYSNFIFSYGNILFSMGVITAIASEKIKIRNAKTSIFLFMASFVIYIYWDYLQADRTFLYDFLVGIFSCLFIITLLGAEPLFDNKIFRPLIVLGNISYSLYLIHLPILNFFVKKILPYNLPTSLEYFLFAILIGVIIFFSYLSYIFIEKPSVRFLNKMQDKSQNNIQLAK